MKRLIPILLCIIMLSACETHTDSNGDLDGYWLLKEVDTLSTGTKVNIAQEKRFWRIQGKLFQAGNVFCLHERQGDTLRLYRPYLHDWHEDSLLNSPDLLRPYGINHIDQRFKIVHLSSSHLIVEDSLLRLGLEKY
ncbi:MAG: lipocalin-like domain-containing protein [Prevotella sp.]